MSPADMGLQGLPPPTRGILFQPLFNVLCRRSTPAHAGNTDEMIDGMGVGEVYPRPRGEYRRPRRQPPVG